MKSGRINCEELIIVIRDSFKVPNLYCTLNCRRVWSTISANVHLLNDFLLDEQRTWPYSTSGPKPCKMNMTIPMFIIEEKDQSNSKSKQETHENNRRAKEKNHIRANDNLGNSVKMPQGLGNGTHLVQRYLIRSWT